MKNEYIKLMVKVYQVQPATLLAGSGTTEQIEVGGSGPHRTPRYYDNEEWE